MNRRPRASRHQRPPAIVDIPRSYDGRRPWRARQLLPLSRSILPMFVASSTLQGRVHYRLLPGTGLLLLCCSASHAWLVGECGWQSALIRAGEMRKASSRRKRTIPTVLLEGRPEGTLGKGGDGFCQRDILSAYSLAAYGARFVVDGEVVVKRTSSHTWDTSYSLLK
jgi:hypothetical protein